MTTNTKKTTATAETATPPQTARKTPPPPAPVVGPAASTAGTAEPETIVLSHHLRIDGTEYPPGSTIRVWPDYARRLRSQGYVART
ncbi:hypothetical protein [Streptomyces xantholiticus]|uniref:DUF7210 domain-containing protein n=1 Tax=Streptomyces xantholiticus TaxID=68285 RepID=A0ABV1V161_9ACTN